MNVILSVVQGMECEAVAPFLASFAATGSDAKIHFFTSGVSAQSIGKMKSMGATVHPFPYLTFRRKQPLLYLWPVWRWMMERRDFEGKCALGRKVFYVAALRFILYYDFLEKHRGGIENVLLTDSRDVFFQSDPFSDNLGPGLHCFLEAKTQFIGKCPSNSAMLGKTFGPQVLAELADRRVSCSGTTIGDVDTILAYLKKMIELSATGIKMFGGSDQGVHNYIVHHNSIPSMYLHDNYDSTVFTAGCEPWDTIRMNAENEIIRNDGKRYPILHQYERDPSVRKKIHAKVGLP